MSQETAEWLNNMTLIGCTDKRGNAWHYREELQGAESNHYPSFVPVDDVLRRLFNFEVIESPLYIPDGQGGFKAIPGRKAMVTDDTQDVLGVFKDGYAGHRYQDWLVKNVGTLLSDELGIGSAGLLKNRGVAWVSVEVPESITTPEGVEFRPNLLAATSFTGELATTYKRVVQEVVCDNTMAAGLSEAGQTYRVKHSRYSNLKLAEAREALAVVHTISEDFAAEVAKLTAVKINTRQFDLVLDAVLPVPDFQGELTTGQKRSLSMVENKRDAIKVLYVNDPRVAPWKNTAFGVLQAFNTYNHHEASRKGAQHRAQTNMMRAIDGSTAADDQIVLDALAGVAG